MKPTNPGHEFGGPFITHAVLQELAERIKKTTPAELSVKRKEIRGNTARNVSRVFRAPISVATLKTQMDF